VGKRGKGARLLSTSPIGNTLIFAGKNHKFSRENPMKRREIPQTKFSGRDECLSEQFPELAFFNHQPPMELKDKLRQLRLAANLSITQAAERVGVHQSTYSDWESGHTHPKFVQYPKFAAAFNVSVLRLLPDEIAAAIEQEALTKNGAAKLESSNLKHQAEVIETLKATLTAKDDLIVHLKDRVQRLETELEKLGRGGT
jgi:transcriptional regulator with XRE-family HTH domain